MPQSRGRKQSKKGQLQRPPQLTPLLTIRSILFSHGRKILSALVLILGIGASVATFLPRITVTPSGPIDSKTASPITFDVLNSGIIPLNRLQATLGVCDMEYQGSRKFKIVSDAIEDTDCRGSLSQARLSFQSYPMLALRPDERWTVSLSDFPALAAISGMEPKALAISVIVTFRPIDFIPFTRTSEFKFETRSAADGRLYWFSLPLDAPVTPQSFDPDGIIVLEPGLHRH